MVFARSQSRNSIGWTGVRRIAQLLKRAGRDLLPMLLVLAGAGCSSFHRDWKQAIAEPIPTNGLAGPWTGTWQSEITGHTDKLQCLVTPQTDAEYRARFHAKYKTILSVGYTITLKVTETNGVYQFDGDADIGWFRGGIYHYDGRVTGTNFFSIYRSKADHGNFQMTRPQPPKS